MSKRKLTRQQQFRIEKIQQERLARAKRKGDSIEEKFESGALSEGNEGLVIAHYGASIDVESPEGVVTRCHVRSNLPTLVTGDRVIWHADEQGQGVISAVKDRRTILTRPDYRGQLRPVAANIDRIVIVVCPSPRTPVNLIDRYLVAARHDSIQPVILLNKIDLIEKAPEMQQELDEYQALGCEIAVTSATQQETIANLQQLVSTGNTVFVGQSGVGKSSLISALLPAETIRVGEISDATGKGKHTTTTAKLYHIPTGGCLVDSPGIREFGLWHVSPEALAAGFHEIADTAGYCKFADCTHTHEPHCAVKAAVEEGKILARRLASYLAIRDSLDEVTMRT